LLNAVLLLRSLQLFRQPNRVRTVSMYKFSMAYLASVFLAMALERSLGS